MNRDELIKRIVGESEEIDHDLATERAGVLADLLEDLDAAMRTASSHQTERFDGMREGILAISFATHTDQLYRNYPRLSAAKTQREQSAAGDKT